MSRELDLYLIPTRRGRYVLYCRAEVLEDIESQSGHRIRQFIDWVMRRRIRIVAWAGRVLNTGYNYYVKLEDRIDPQERVLKAMAAETPFVVHFIRQKDRQSIGDEFERVLKRQRVKHVFWFAVDVVVSAVVLVFTPVLAPLPGPNVMFYYPVLRVLSHYHAIRGTKFGLHCE